MPDKKYKELMARLDQKKKQGGNFRSYEKIRQDVRAREQKEKERTERTEASNSREKKSIKLNFLKKNYFLENITKSVIPFIVVIILIILSVYLLTNKNATEISVNDDVIGHLKPADIALKDFLETLTAKIEQIEETKIRIRDEISLVPVHAKSKLLKDDSEMLNLMAEIVSYDVLAAEITVDGTKVGTAKSQEEAQSIFESLKAPYMTEGENVTAEFMQDVLAIDTYVSKEQIDSSEYIKAELSKETSSNIEYEVVEGDTLSKIASMNGVTVNDIKDSNPDLDVTRPLQIGQKLNIASSAPYVSVITTENIVEITEIPMTVTEQPDPSVPQGQRKIIQQGKPGKKETVTQVIRINGIITSRNDMSESILEPAEPQIVSVGTG